MLCFVSIIASSELVIPSGPAPGVGHPLRWPTQSITCMQCTPWLLPRILKLLLTAGPCAFLSESGPPRVACLLESLWPAT